MPKLNQRGVVHFLLPLILLLGIIAGVWLITNGNPLKLFSKAGGGPIWFTDVNGNTLPVKNNIPQTTSAKVRIELYSTLGPPPKSISSPVSFNPLVSTVYAQENTICPGGCADSQGNGANGLKCDPQSWTRKDYTQCTSTGTYYYCYSSCSKPSTTSPAPVQDTKSCPGGTTACGGSNRDNLGSCSTDWSYPGNPDWNNWCLKNAGGADAYCYSCSVPTPTSTPTPTTSNCPGSCGNSDRSGLGDCKGGWEYTPKYNASCGAQKYCYVCDNQIQNPTPPIPSPIPQPPIPQPPDTPPVGQPPPITDILPVPQPTNPPEPTPRVRYTTSYRIAENPTDLAQAPWLNYTEEPTIVNKYSGGVYEFKDQTLGVKFIWVEFKANDGSIDRKSAQIEIVSPTPSPSPIPSPTPSPSASCSLGMYIKFQDITSNGPSEKFVSLSLKQPGTSTQLWKFDSVPASTNTAPLVNTNKDLYRVGIGNVACGTYDIYVSSRGYQEKKYPNILVDNNPNSDPEVYIFNGPLIPISPTPSPSPIPLPSPTPTPPAYKRVFITSQSYGGMDLGGVRGADAKCQERANAVNLGGSWVAWISSSTQSAASRLTHHNVPYVLVNGYNSRVANNWNDLVDSPDVFLRNIQSPINIDENSSQIPVSYVWTNTDWTGRIVATDPLKSCLDWSVDAVGSSGNVGRSDEMGSRWTHERSVSCDSRFAQARLYCFEQ